MIDSEVYATEFAKRITKIVEDYAPYLMPDEMAGCLESEVAKLSGYEEFKIVIDGDLG